MGSMFGGASKAAAKAAEEQARRERERYEMEMEKQRQSALLDASNQIENVTKVEVGGSADISTDMFTGKKKRSKSSQSTALGVM